MRTAWPVLLLLVLPVPAWGDEAAERWAGLRSPDPRRVAWTAWQLRVAPEPGLGPALGAALTAALERRLAASRERPCDELPYLVDAGLAHAWRPPAPLLMELARSDPHGAVLLLCANGRASAPDALRLFDVLTPGTIPWKGLGNALCTWRTPGFAARLLGRLAIHVTVCVSDGGPPATYRPGSTSLCCEGRLNRGPGWPPGLALHVGLEAEPDARELVAPPHGVYLRRLVARAPRGVGDVVVCRSEDAADAWRARWLGLPLPAHPVCEVRFVGRQPWFRAVAALGRGVRDAVVARAQVLVAEGLLAESPDPAQWRPRIRWRVVDLRRDPRRALPPLPGTRARAPPGP